MWGRQEKKNTADQTCVEVFLYTSEGGRLKWVLLWMISACCFDMRVGWPTGLQRDFKWSQGILGKSAAQTQKYAISHSQKASLPSEVPILSKSKKKLKKLKWKPINSIHPVLSACQTKVRGFISDWVCDRSPCRSWWRRCSSSTAEWLISSQCVELKYAHSA